MASAGSAASQGRIDATRFYTSASLDPAMVGRWRTFAQGVPWAHYRQDPAWAEIAHGGEGATQPHFFWAERDGALRLTAVGWRRRLPVPGRSFWEFDMGPTFRDLDALDEWLPSLLARLGREAARLRMAPPVPLLDGGDDIETALERHGLVRRRTLGGWATLVTDISRDEDEILRAFRSATQRSIRKSQRLGIEVNVEDSPAGWAALSALQTELARRTPVDRLTRRRRAHQRLWLRQGSGGAVLVARYRESRLPPRS